MLNNNMKQAICQQCFLSFKPSPGSFGKFCSLSCGNIFRAKHNLEESIVKYNQFPKLCKCCNIPLLYEKRRNTYCSKSCSAKISNKIARKRGPTAKEKPLFSKIKFILCTYTNQFYLNKNKDGSTRRCSPFIKTLKEQYYNSARFKFNVYHYPDEFDLLLIKEFGWYTCPGKKRKHQPKNISGVSRDHIISVSYGFANNIDPTVLSHPANCKIMIHSDNKIKHNKCDITLDQLLIKIKVWEQKYTERCIGLEPTTSCLEGKYSTN